MSKCVNSPEPQSSPGHSSWVTTQAPLKHLHTNLVRIVNFLSSALFVYWLLRAIGNLLIIMELWILILFNLTKWMYKKTEPRNSSVTWFLSYVGSLPFTKAAQWEKDWNEEKDYVSQYVTAQYCSQASFGFYVKSDLYCLQSWSFSRNSMEQRREQTSLPPPQRGEPVTVLCLSSTHQQCVSRHDWGVRVGTTERNISNCASNCKQGLERFSTQKLLMYGSLCKYN